MESSYGVILSGVLCREEPPLSLSKGPMNSLAAPVLPASCVGPSPPQTRLKMTSLMDYRKNQKSSSPRFIDN